MVWLLIPIYSKSLAIKFWEKIFAKLVYLDEINIKVLLALKMLFEPYKKDECLNFSQ